MSVERLHLLAQLGHAGCDCREPRGWHCPLEVARRASVPTPTRTVARVEGTCAGCGEHDALTLGGICLVCAEVVRIHDELDEDERASRLSFTGGE